MRRARWAAVAGATIVTVAVGTSQMDGPPPVADGKACVRQRAAVVVKISRVKSPEAVDHFEDAFAGRDDDGIYRVRRQPRVLHWDPAGASKRRAAAMRASGLRSRPDQDRDEIAPAASLEGGETSDVRFVDDSDNQSAGATMGAVMRRYCRGQAFRLVGR
jgi:hypothetical protein